MNGRDFEDRVVAYVRRAAAVRGHGVLGRAHKAAGLESSYLRTMSPGAVSVRHLRAIVEGCDMEPSEAIRYALDEGAVARFVADGRRLAPEVKDFPAAVRETVYRMRAWWDEQSGGIDLDAIDAQRYEDPPSALKAIDAALGVVSGPKTYAKALGIWGSAQRMCYRLDYATMGVGLAIEAAQAACDRALLADTLVRSAYVLRDRGELDWALEVGDTLLELRASLCDRDGMGRAFVVHGSLLRSAGDHEESIRCNRAALGLLDEESESWRFFAHNQQSLAHLDRGDLPRAEAAAEAAGAVGMSTPDLAGRLAWVRARIARQRGVLPRAAGFYRDAFSLLEHQAIDAGLVGTEWVRLLLEAGLAREAQVLAAGLSGIADSISEHPFDYDQAISAAVLDLSLAGLQAKASVALASKVVETVERRQTAVTARLRQDLRL